MTFTATAQDLFDIAVTDFHFYDDVPHDATDNEIVSHAGSHADEAAAAVSGYGYEAIEAGAVEAAVKLLHAEAWQVVEDRRQSRIDDLVADGVLFYDPMGASYIRRPGR